jgi:hypothetical protein
MFNLIDLLRVIAAAVVVVGVYFNIFLIFQNHRLCTAAATMQHTCACI